jgi:hypothetical protein
MCNAEACYDRYDCIVELRFPNVIFISFPHLRCHCGLSSALQLALIKFLSITTGVQAVQWETVTKKQCSDDPKKDNRKNRGRDSRIQTWINPFQYLESNLFICSLGSSQREMKSGVRWGQNRAGFSLSELEISNYCQISTCFTLFSRTITNCAYIQAYNRLHNKLNLANRVVCWIFLWISKAENKCWLSGGKW